MKKIKKITAILAIAIATFTTTYSVELSDNEVFSMKENIYNPMYKMLNMDRNPYSFASNLEIKTAKGVKTEVIIDFDNKSATIQTSVDDKALFNYSYKELYSFLKDYGDLQMLQLWNNQFASKNSGRTKRETDDTVDWQALGHQNGTKLFGIGGTKLDVALGGSVGVDFSKTTSNIPNSYDPGLESDIQFDFNSKFSVALGDRARANVEFATSQSGEFTASGDDIVAEFIYKGKDSLDLEDNIIQEVHAGWNIDMSFNSLSLVKTNFFNNSHGIKVRSKLGFLDMNTVVAVAESPTKKATERGSSSSGPEILSYNFKTNAYFFLDSTYSKVFEWGVSKNSGLPEIDRSTFELYLSIDANETNKRLEAEGDPLYSNYMEYSNGNYIKSATKAKFIKLKNDYYKLDQKSGYIKLDKSLGYKLDNAILAVFYKRVDGTTDANYLISPLTDNSNGNLKVIKPENIDQEIDHPYIKYYRWTNVYSLDVSDIDDISSINLKVYRRDDNSNRVENNKNGRSYSSLLGVTDKKGIINKTYIDAEKEFIIFPQKKPFIDETAIEKEFLQPKLYDSLPSSSKNIFSMEVKGGNSFIKLMHYPVVSGSERIEAGGVVLSKGTDYNIDYISGEITLLSATAIANVDNLNIEYNYEELFSLSSQLTIAHHMGVNLSNINDLFGQRSSVNFLWLWHEESYDKTEDVEMGQEPFSNTAIGGNIRLGYDIPIITDLANKIPGVETDATSSVDVSAEMVHIISNPLNTTDNYVLIDNFESTTKSYPIPLTYDGWQFASTPVGIDSTRADSSYWFTNSYQEVPVKDVWPNKETVSTDAGIRPLQINVVSTDTNQWMGMTRFINLRDINEYNYIDFWVKVDSDNSTAPAGKIHIDLGDISEDINGDNSLNYEGAIDDITYNINVGDDGLDTLTDSEEVLLGINPRLDNYVGVSSEEASAKKGAYRKVNQTQGNGKRDTEDLDQNQQLDTLNNYLSYSIDMTKSIVNDGVYSDENSNGWRHFRIPLALDTTFEELSGKVEGIKPTKKINYVRLWVEQEKVGETRYQIAAFELKGNNWLSNIGGVKDFNPVIETEKVFITSLNNQEDRDKDNTGYLSPNGDKQDATDHLLIKEEAIRLNFTNIEPGHEANIYKDAGLQAWSFIKYDTLSFFAKSETNSFDKMFIRLYSSVNSDNDYYEISMPLDVSINNDADNHYGWTEFNFPVDSLLKVKENIIKGGRSIQKFGEYTVSVAGNPVLSSVNKISLGVLNNTINSQTGSILFNDLKVKGVDKSNGNKFEVNVNTSISDVTSFNSTVSYKDNAYHEVDERFGDDNATLRANVSNILNVDKFQLYKYGFKIPVNTGISRSISRPSYYGDIKLSDDGLSEIWDDFSTNNGRGFEATKSEEFQTMNNSKTFGVSLSKSRMEDKPMIKYLNPVNLVDEFLLIRSKYDYGYSNSDNLSITSEDTTINNVGSWNLDLSRKGESYKLAKDDKSTSKSDFLQVKNDVGFTTGFNVDVNQSFNYSNQNRVNKDLFVSEDSQTDSAKIAADSLLNTPIRTRNVTLSQSVSTGYNLLNIMPITWGVNVAKDISEDVDSAYSKKTGNFVTEIVDKSTKMENTGKIDGIFYNEVSHSQNFSLTFNPSLISFLTTTSKYNSSFSQSYSENYYSDVFAIDTSLSNNPLEDSTYNSIDVNQNNSLDLGLSLDIVTLFEVNKSWKSASAFMKKNRFRKVGFNYTRKETQSVYDINSDLYSFENYSSLLSYQHGFSHDTRLFSDEKSRYFYVDTNNTSTKKIVENEYKWNTGFMVYNPLMVKYTPSVSNSQEEYIHIESNRTTEELDPFDLSWDFKNYPGLRGLFKKTSFTGGFSKKFIYEYNFDTTITEKTIDNSWRILAADLSFKNNNWSIASQVNYDWSYDSTLYEDEHLNTSSNFTSNTSFTLQPSYSKNLDYFLELRGRKFRIDKVDLSFPLTMNFKKEQATSSGSGKEQIDRAYEFKPEAKAYFWKSRITSKAYASWSRKSDITADTVNDFWKFGVFFQVNFRTSK